MWHWHKNGGFSTRMVFICIYYVYASCVQYGKCLKPQLPYMSSELLGNRFGLKGKSSWERKNRYPMFPSPTLGPRTTSSPALCRSTAIFWVSLLGFIVTTFRLAFSGFVLLCMISAIHGFLVADLKEECICVKFCCKFGKTASGTWVYCYDQTAVPSVEKHVISTFEKESSQVEHHGHVGDLVCLCGNFASIVCPSWPRH
jgi:hypothetical protein